MTQAQAEAVLFGHALGDALGWPTEFLSLKQIKEEYGAQGIQEPPNPALYTDDTQMTVALTEGLLDVGLYADLDAQMNAVGRRFIEWRDTAPSRAPGNTCLTGVKRFELGFNWRESGIAGSKGCGSAMRVVTLGYLYQHDTDKLIEMAKASGIITHGHPAAVAACVAAAYLVKLALDGVHPREYLAAALDITNGISEEFDQVMYRVGQAHVASEEQCLRHIGQGWVGDEAVGLALWCVQRFPDNYVAVVRRGANTNGDSDSVACIAGGISAAYLGLDAIPQDWRDRCENREMLLDLSERMFHARENLYHEQS
jgi:ADP-ribosylglycohydrolase